MHGYSHPLQDMNGVQGFHPCVGAPPPRPLFTSYL
jgi:hypothetical protein